jgi:hypothetical protein
MLAAVDGKPTMFTGDAVGHTEGNELSASFVCRNRIFLGSGALATARQLYRWAPYVICPAHSDPFVCDTEQRRRYLDWAVSAKDAISGLIAQPHPAMGFDPYWVRIEPYLSQLKPGSAAECSLVVRNYFPVAAEFEADLRLPEGLKASPERLEGAIEPGAERRFSFSLGAGAKPGGGQPTGVSRQPIAADVTFAGRRWGELTEALVEVGE